VMDKENNFVNVNLLYTKKKPKNGYRRSLHNTSTKDSSPQSKQRKFKETKDGETRERATTSLLLARPSTRVIGEYYQNINEFLIKKDVDNKISKDYMQNQNDINAKMRVILVDWMVEVHLKFELLPQTFFSCIQLLDRYLETVVVVRNKLQLVGITCLMIVAKMEEVYVPMVKDYLAVCDNAYSRKELLDMEGQILAAVNFNVLCPTPFSFLTNFNTKIQMEDKLFYYAQYMLETAMTDLSYLKHNMAFLTAGAIFFTNKLFKKEGWNSEYQKLTGISESELKLAAKDLFVIMQKSDKSNLKAVHRKFQDPQFLEASKYTIQKSQSKN